MIVWMKAQFISVPSVENILLLPDPPVLIVTSRLADEYLWAEALNPGAYDVLASRLTLPKWCASSVQPGDTGPTCMTIIRSDALKLWLLRERHRSGWKKSLLPKTISGDSKSDSGLLLG
jgi:hypothetical protein